MAKKIRTEKERAEINTEKAATIPSGGKSVFVVYVFKLDISYSICGVNKIEVFKNKEDACAFFKSQVYGAKYDIETEGLKMDDINTTYTADYFHFADDDVEVKIEVLEKEIY